MLNKIEVVEKFLKYMDSVNFDETNKLMEDVIEFNYESLNGIKGNLPKGDVMKTFTPLLGFDKLSHKIENAIIEGDTVIADAHVVHTLDGTDAVLTGKYIAKVNDANKIYSWSIENPNLTNPQLFKEAMQIAVSKMGSK